MSEPIAAGSLRPTRTGTATFHVDSLGPVDVTVQDRDRTRRGEPVWYLVPDGVVQYIAKHHLYTQGDPPPVDPPTVPTGVSL